MRLHVFNRTLLLSHLLVLAFVAAHAQVPVPAPSNPLMRMIAAQPGIDVTTPVVATVSFDPPLVRPGEKSVYRITFNALDASIRLPDRFPEPDGLRFRLSAQGQVLQTSTNIFKPFTTFAFDVRADKPGQYVVPSFVAAVEGKPVDIPEAALEVRADLPQPHATARQLILECDATNAFVGETVVVRALSPSWESNIVQAVTQVEFKGDGFLQNKNATKQSITSLDRGGRRIPTFIYETTVTLIAAGSFALSVQGFTAGRHFNGPITIQGNVTIPGGPPQHLLLDSEPVTFNAKPVPVEGKLPGYTGAIGKLAIDPPTLTTNAVPIGDPVHLTVIFRSSSDLSRLDPPPPPRANGWQILPANSVGLVGGDAHKTPGVAFSYTLIPTADDIRSTPEIPFSYFDPRQAAYVDLTIPSVPVTVIPNGLPLTLATALHATDDDSKSEKRPALNDLSPSPGRRVGSFIPLQLRGWFLAVQILPALGFLGLWMWDERRRFRELHPDLVRRQAARRQLRRQRRLLHRAATDNDAPAYVRGSVAAMQIASAPHYIAEPRALVCGDVLNVLNGSEREGRSGEVVRQFFAAADDSRFAVAPRTPTPSEVFALQSELDEVLSKLEARL